MWKQKNEKNELISFSNPKKKIQVQPMSFSYINGETKMRNEILLFKSEKNVQVQPMSFCFTSAETKMKKLKSIFLSSFKPEKNFMSANEFLLHKCRNNYKKYEFFFSQLKFFFFHNWKNVQVRLMSFYYIKAEMIIKWKNNPFLSNPKKWTSPANEFLLQTDGHTFTPRHINVIVPSYLRYVVRMRLYSVKY